MLADASSSSGISTRSGGAARWCPPEVLKGEPSSFESDIYAFGCVCVEVSLILLDLFNLQSFTKFSLFFQLYTLNRPFPEHNDAQVVAKVLKGIRPKRPSPETGIQLYIWSLARRCWTVKASRPDIEAVLDSLANQRIVPLSIPPRSPPTSPKRIHRHHTSTPSNSTLAELAELATSDSDGHSYSISSTPSVMSPFFPPSESLDHSPQSVDFLGHGHSRSSSPRDRSSLHGQEFSVCLDPTLYTDTRVRLKCLLGYQRHPRNSKSCHRDHRLRRMSPMFSTLSFCSPGLRCWLC